VTATTEQHVDQAGLELAGGPLREQRLGLLLLVTGLVGFTAAFVLTVEKFWLLTNPFYMPSCTVNATVSCGPVMTSPLGIAGFAVVATTGAALLAGGRLAGWYWAGLQAGSSLAVVFVAWLISQSLFVIGALCPYCIVVWAVTLTVFWYVTLRNLTAHRRPRVGGLVEFAVRYHSTLLVLGLAAVAALVIITIQVG
jgi:uncharacterized membrane protein